MDLKDKIVGMAKNAIPTPMPTQPTPETPIVGQPEMPMSVPGGSDPAMDNFKMMVSALFSSEVQVHIFHLQTVGAGSFAAHMALNGYYTGIQDLLDGLIESYQGKYSIVTGYKSMEYKDFTSVQDLVTYFTELDGLIEMNRSSIKESYLQNQIDTIVELINSTLYKLKNLQ